MTFLTLLTCAACATDLLPPGDHNRKLVVDDRHRSYHVHIPAACNHETAAPVVLVFHGAATNAGFIIPFTGMNQKSEEAGFIAVYPNGTGPDPFLSFNAGGRIGPRAGERPDDVKFVRAVLDDLSHAANLDSRRIYATGFSNGGMMCYRLAAEMPDRIAAIAPVAGTVAGDISEARTPVSVMHIHGTDDAIVPWNGSSERTPESLSFSSVEESVALWRRINGCPDQPVLTELPDLADDGTSVQRQIYGPGKDGAEVVLLVINGGGHTWPGQVSPIGFLGKSTRDISANDLIWDFFRKHPMR